MHRLILGITDRRVEVDHIHHKKLDNRRSELRICTHADNTKNVGRARGKSGFICVAIKHNKTKSGKINGPYIKAEIRIEGKNTHLGYFKTAELAARAYDEAAKIHHGEYASLNFK